jgi:hypothetical protein
MTHTILVALAWSGDALSLYAALLIAKRKRIAFALFVLADLMLMGVQVESRVWSQLFLFGCFTIVNAWGYLRWKNN